jgi:hypothetical protein
MKTNKFLNILFLLLAGNYLNAQIDSIQYGRDKSIPSRVIFSEKQKD